MKIACCVICRDDSEFDLLVKTVNSVAPYVDDIFITTSGKEVSKVKMFCTMNKIHYSHREWDDDFSAQRNFNFDQAVAHDNYDYIFWLDADDVLVGGTKLREVAENAKRSNLDIVFFTYWYGCAFDGEPSEKTFKEVQLEHMRERLIRPGTNIWKSRLHETPVPVPRYEPKYSKYPYDSKDRPIVIMHLATDTFLEEKMLRNKMILERQLQDEQSKGEADPRTLLYLMKIYAEIGTEELSKACITMGEEYLSKSGWDMERGVCHEQMGIAYGKMGDHAKAAEHFHLAIGEYPHQVLWYVRLAQAYFNVKRYREAEHWMKMGAQIDIDNTGNDQTNIKAIKVGFSELLLNLNWNIKKDVQKALNAANLLYKENPTEANKENLLFIQDAFDLNEACRKTDELAQYLHSINEDKSIIKLLNSLPNAITTQQFAINLRQRFAPPRKWAEHEIAYFANFNGPFFEKWDAKNLNKGIGGSETAVIELAKEWAKLNWLVTVYGDPEKPGLDEFGINWLPWYFFNPRDSFNIVTQWRNWELAGQIKTRKFFVDLHDIVSPEGLQLEHIQNIDKVFFKSKAHRELLPNLPEEKAMIVGNGVRA